MINLYILTILGFTENNPGLAVFISVLAILATGAIGYLLFRIEKKERKRYREEVANFIEGVSNKREITAEVNSYIAKASTKEFAMLYIDIDKYSRVIETIGKEEANNIVKAIAAKIISILPVRVSIGRMEQDRFVVFVKTEFTRDDTVKLARQILEVINQPLKLYGDATFQVSASIGICFYPQHGRSFKQMMESLELACYQAKKDGGNKYRIYTHENNESQNLEYYNQIKEGIKSHQFDLFFQPMIDGSKEDIYAIEGLLRWNHPELGVLSPHKFITIMEQTGDINWVGLWGLETLIKEWFRLKKKYNREFKMSLNLSQLKDLGFDIAVDGFGLDYKALKQLEQSSINVLKLDREYLSGASDASLKEKFIEILVDFSKNHNLTLVCEGVEDFNYLTRAKSMGCELYQGYYFAKPMDRESLDNFITGQDWKEKLHHAPAYEEAKKEEPKEAPKEEPKEESKEAPVEDAPKEEPSEEKSPSEDIQDSGSKEDKPIEENVVEEDKKPQEEVKEDTNDKK